MIDELRAIGIDVNHSMTGKVKIKCPNCTPHNRKPKNRNAKDLSVDVHTGLYKCHNCGWKGGVGNPDENDYQQETVYSLPDPNELIKMSNEAEQYLMSRGISRSVIKENGIKMNKFGSIIFPYYMHGTLVNTKVRSTKKKEFRQAGS